MRLYPYHSMPLHNRLALDYVTESFMITNFMVATRSGTSDAGINLPPVHGAQKAIDLTLKPENQSKTQEILAKPTPITPGKKLINPAVKWTPVQATPKPTLKSPSLSTSKTHRSLLNTPVHHQTPIKTNTPSLTPGTQQRAHQQTPVRSQLITKTPISAAQSVSRKVIQKSVKLLNTPKHKPNPKSYPQINPSAKLFPSTDTSVHTGNESLEAPQLKMPVAPLPKLPPQQVLLPQEILLI